MDIGTVVSAVAGLIAAITGLLAEARRWARPQKKGPPGMTRAAQVIETPVEQAELKPVGRVPQSASGRRRLSP
jgi:hypothetical protein